jgi:hypothetical protein
MSTGVRDLVREAGREERGLLVGELGKAFWI